MSRFIVIAMVGVLSAWSAGCEMGPPGQTTSTVKKHGTTQGAATIGSTERPRAGSAIIKAAKSAPGVAAQAQQGNASTDSVDDDPSDDGCSQGTGGVLDLRCSSTGAGANHGVPQPLDPSPAVGTK